MSYSLIQSVEMFRLHGLARIIKVVYDNGTIFLTGCSAQSWWGLPASQLQAQRLSSNNCRPCSAQRAARKQNNDDDCLPGQSEDSSVETRCSTRTASLSRLIRTTTGTSALILFRAREISSAVANRRFSSSCVMLFTISPKA